MGDGLCLIVSSMGVNIGSVLTGGFESAFGGGFEVGSFSGSDWTGVELHDCFVGSV